MHAASRRRRPSRARRPDFTFAPGQELHDLLWPMSPAEFLADYFEKRPLHLRGGADKFAQLFSRALYDRAIEQGVGLRVDFPPQPQRAGQTFPCQLEQIEPLLALGGTVCAAGLERRVPRLGRLLDGIKRQMHYPGVVDLRCYLSGDGAGFATHFDARVACALQITGKKRWRFSREPGVRDPLTNAVKTVRGFVYTPPLPNEPPLPQPDESQFVEVVLEPGDLLCLPAGTWHEASGVGESLALTIAFNPCTPADLLVTLLRESAHDRHAWRRALPAALAEPGAPSPVPALVADALAEPLAELRQLLADPLPALTRLWHERALPPRPPSPSPAPLRRSQRLRRLVPMRYFVEGDQVCLYPGGLTLERARVALLERLATCDELVAADVQRWGRPLAWADAAALIAALLRAGILAPVADD